MRIFAAYATMPHMLRLTTVALVYILAPGLAMADAAISGWACVVDGDGLSIGGKLTKKKRCEGGIEVRLYGVDAFEWDQTCQDEAGKDWRCGYKAKGAMIGLVRKKVTTCQHTGIFDRYKRPVVTCFAGGKDLGRELVAKGLAIAYRRYSDRYAGEEETAQAERRGAHAGTFIPPEQWRRENR